MYVIFKKRMCGVQRAAALALMLFLCVFTTSAQSKQVTGTVTDSNGDALIGVSVVETGTTNGSITDFSGVFSFMLTQENAQLTISYIGFKTQTIEVGDQTSFNVILMDDVTNLDEFVVVGYGIQKKSVLTGAISSIKSDEIAQSPVATVDQALQGRTAGVNVTSNSGAPGAGIQVKIRGVGTNGDSSPLYIVDGMQVSNLDFLNPNDIESMEVLKDAASAAIYGSRAANGVVLVTTKKGQAGDIKVSYDGYYGVQNAWKQADVLNANDYMLLHNEASVNDGLAAKYSESFMANNRINTNWQDEVFAKNAAIQNHAVSLNGGNEMSTFAMSLGYFAQDGIVGGGDVSNFDRITFRINSEHKVSKKVTFGQNLTIAAKSSQGIEEQNTFGGLLNSAYLHDPLTPALIRDAETSAIYDKLPNSPVKNNDGLYYGISDKNLNEVANPLAQLQNTYNQYNDRNIIGNAYLKVDFMPGLSFKTDFGVDMYNSFSRSFSPEQYLNTVNIRSVNGANQSTNDNFGYQWENVLTYVKNLEDHSVTVIAGNTLQEYSGKYLEGSRSNINPAGWHYAWLNTGADDDSQKSSGGYWQNRLASFFGRVNYNYKEKYMIEATVRHDGSSRFGQNYKFGTFPSVSAGWNVSQEDFFQDNIEAISFMKIRGSWGQVGNQNIGDFGYLALAGRALGYPINGSLVNGIGINRMANPDLRWETSEQINVGLDVGFFNNKLYFTGEYYKKTTKDLLGEMPIPDYIGLEAPLFNMATVQNEGVELNLTYAKRNGDFTYDITANTSYNKNRVTDISNQDGFIPGNGNHLMSGQTRMQVGYSLPYFFGYKTSGIFQNQEEIDNYVDANGNKIQPDAKPGDIIFQDLNGDGVIDDNDRTNIGNPIPEWNFGLTFNAAYKNFDFSIFFQGAAGFDIANVMRRADLENQNYSSRALERWTGEGSTNSYPRMTYDDVNRNYTNLNDMVHIEDGSFLRIKNIQVGYTLPNKAAEYCGFSRARVYVSAQNVYTFSNYSGYDPELASWNIFDTGMDRGGYPVPRIIMMGVNLNF